MTVLPVGDADIVRLVTRNARRLSLDLQTLAIEGRQIMVDGHIMPKLHARHVHQLVRGDRVWSVSIPLGAH